MENETPIILVILLLLGVAFYGSYKLGRDLESSKWREVVAEGQAEFCNQCAEVGYNSAISYCIENR